HGFSVVDLGVDVDPERVVRAVDAERPDVLGLSCLLTTGLETLRETITLTREHTAGWEPRPPVVIGGAAIDQRTADHAGADGWCSTAADGIAVVRSLVE
ncbi:MAG: cobalamin-dependent protein, partial [Actinobacteria bacterium]|nr:cobalamin-dependent protein [Actinomycetota bacterium]